jgi:hypothetical protein
VSATSFYQYLLRYRPEISYAGHLDGDPVSDLAREVGADPNAPLKDAELYNYLLHGGHGRGGDVPEDVLNEAWLTYQQQRSR